MICRRCGGAKVVRGDCYLIEIPCPICCIVTDPPEPEPPDLTSDAVPDPDPAAPLELDLDEHETPTVPAPPPPPEDRPTPVVEVEIPQAAIRPNPLEGYRRALERLPPVRVPDELKKKSKP